MLKIIKNGNFRLLTNPSLQVQVNSKYQEIIEDEVTFDVTFEKQFLTEKENSDKEVYLCAVVDGRIIGIAGLNQKGQNKIRHRVEFGMEIEKDFGRI